MVFYDLGSLWNLIPPSKRVHLGLLFYVDIPPTTTTIVDVHKNEDIEQKEMSVEEILRRKDGFTK